MHFDFMAYRDWAIYLASCVKMRYAEKHQIHIHKEGEPCKSADVVFLIGWSDILPEQFYKDRVALVLHPSPLPRYRGGSPIQHQIIAGEEVSAVTVFKLDKKYPAVDSGPIYGQLPYSLKGDLKDILIRIADVGFEIVCKAIEDCIKSDITFVEQNDTYATTFKRRKPEESEITPLEISISTAEQLYNKIRALQDPYPNAFIIGKDGEKVYLTQAHL